TDEIEDGGGFEDYGVTAGSEFAGVGSEMGFFASTSGEFLRVEGADVGGVGFGPTGGGIFLHGDGKFGVRFAVSGEKAARISESGLGLAVRIDSGGDLAFFDGEIAGAADGAGALFSGKSGGVLDE